MPIPVLLLTGLITELATWFWVGRSTLAWSPWLSAAFALLAVLGVRALVMAFIWLFSRHFASPAPQLRPAQWLRLLGSEFMAFVFTFLCLLPLEVLWMRRDRLRRGPQPLLLVHGYGCSRGVWWLLRRELERAGHVVATVSLTPAGADIDAMALQLERRIDQVLDACASNQLTLIGHSMGGLVSRAYLARAGSGKVAQLITLATPHQGSELARLGLGKNARQMQPGSPFLRRLAAAERTLPVTSIRTEHDEFVTPQDNQRLSGARDIARPCCGHLALLYCSRSSKLLLELLATKQHPNGSTLDAPRRTD